MDEEQYNKSPRDFALQLVEDGQVAADHMLLCCLKRMDHDEVREMLDVNEWSPRFDEDDED